MYLNGDTTEVKMNGGAFTRVPQIGPDAKIEGNRMVHRRSSSRWFVFIDLK
jgi:hypothetical protein